MLNWTLHRDGKSVADDTIVKPDERLTWPRTIGFGAQHVVAMFGATFLVPTLTGFPVTATLFFSGLGTLLFLVLTQNRLPSYLGSSFAFLAPIGAVAASGASIEVAMFGIVVTGVLLAAVGAIVMRTGIGWVNALMPPVVAGSIVALIGFNLAPTAFRNASEGPWMATITLVVLVLAVVVFRGFIGRISILVGVVAGYVYAATTGGLDFADVQDADLVGWPDFSTPEISWVFIPAFLPVVLVLIAENVGHVRSVAQLTDDDSINERTGRALLADGLATTIAGAGGGSGTTTYGENIGVMAATRVYSTAAYWVAGVIAILLSFSPKIGALIFTIPTGVLGGVTIALYGLIGIVGVKIWIDNRVDFALPVNQLTAGIALVIGIADPELQIGDMLFNGIALGTVAALVVYHGMTSIERLRRKG